MSTDHSAQRESELLRAALAAVPLGVALFDAASGTLRVNPRAADLLRLSTRGDASTLLLAEPDPVRSDWAAVERALTSQTPIHQLELEVLGGGKVLIDTMPLAAGAGSMSVLTPNSATTDSALGVIAHLTHKLNNPLSTILMSAQLAAGSAGSNPERLARLLNTIQDNAKRCGRILEDVVQRTEPATNGTTEPAQANVPSR